MRNYWSSAPVGATWRRMLAPPAVLGVVIALAAGASASPQAASRPDAFAPGAVAIRPASGPWADLPGSPLRGRAGPLAVRAGRRMIGRGGSGGTVRAAHTSALAPASAHAVSSWGQAIEVPGLAALNAGGNAGVAEVSCTAAGDCAAVGSYRDSDRHDQGFVDGEWHGHWGQAREMPGLGALNKGGQAIVWSVSCASPGNCAAGGFYRDRHRHYQGFVAVERHGHWGQAIEVPGLGALNKGGEAAVAWVSCGSVGDCAAGGYYRDRHRHSQGFVAVERHGHWGRAIEVPGLGALNKGEDAGVDAVACASPGNCTVGGFYRDHHRHYQGFLAAERHGRWGRAIEVPGLGALNQGYAGVTAVGCASAGNCAAGGYFANDVVLRDIGGLFLVGERGGRWRKAVAMSADGAPSSISCTSAGNCVAGGQAACENCYFFVGDAFVAQERAGRWGSVGSIPGLRKLEHYVDPEIAGSWANSVACTSAGNCAAGGGYEYKNHDHGFVAVERNGVWAKAIEVPGLEALNAGRGGAGVMDLSCGSVGDCAAGGYYRDSDQHYQGFVAVERNGA